MKITYLITTYNRDQCLQEHFELMKKQTKKPDQVIVCDDGSTDRTEKIAKKYKAEYYNTGNTDKNTCAKSRNNGIKNATGDGIVMVDVDCLPHSRLIEMYLQNHKKNQVQIGYRSSLKDYLNIDLKEFKVESGKMREYNRMRDNITSGMFTSGNAFMETKIAKTKANDGSIGYDERFEGYGYEDSEFAIRLGRKGYQFVWNKHAIIWHANPSYTTQQEPKRKKREMLRNKELLNYIINEEN